MLKRLTRNLVDYDRADSFGSKMRARRVDPLVRLIERVYDERGSVSIIDVGGTRRYWKILPAGLFERCDVQVTIVNLPGAPNTGGSTERFTHIEGDGCDLAEHAENGFDIAHSNSVIEHVGDWDRVESFAAEMQRVARYYYCQTPHFWFPVEPHCMTPIFHWLPKATRVSMVQRFALGNWSRQTDVREAVRTVESARLLDRRMFTTLFGTDATVRTERFCAWPKSMTAIGSSST
ncbi:MAG: class I SAM-dependent methyltransferase [Phycisphaerales bacterium]